MIVYTTRLILVAVLLLAILATAYRPTLLPFIAVGGFLAIYGAGLTTRVQVWNVFHYWLNAKYIKELGYNDFYSCAYTAGGTEYFGDGAIRNLYTYEYSQPGALPPCPPENFSQARWQEFSDDLAWLRSRPGRWTYLMRDKGLNTTPTWLAMSERLANIAPAGTAGWWLILYADSVLLAAALVLVGFVRGPQIASLMTIFLLTWVGTAPQLMGHWFQYLWLVLCLISLSGWHKKLYAVSGAALALAAALRIFPAVLFVWPLLHWRQVNRRFWLAAIATGLAAMLAGSFTSLGWSVWPQFIDKLLRHARHIVIEPGNLGLRNLIAGLNDPAGALATWRAFGLGDVGGVIFPYPPAWAWAAVAIMAALAAIAMTKKKRMHFGSGLPFLFFGMVVSRYYYGIIALSFDDADKGEVIMLLVISLIFIVLTYWLHPVIGYLVGQFALLVYLYWKVVGR